MEQMTLGGKPKVEISDNGDISDTKEIIEVEEKDEGGWTDPINKRAVDQQQEKGASWEHLQLITTSNLKDGTVRRISISSTSEQRQGFMGSIYGGGGEVDIKNPKSYFDDLMKEKLENQKKPYKDFPNGKEDWEIEGEFQRSSNFYRTIPIINNIVIIGGKLKELLKENGFDFDKWYVEYMAIEENNANYEYDKKVIDWKETAEKELKLMKKAKLIKESIRYKLGARQGEYGGGSVRDYFEDKGLDAIFTELKALSNEIKPMDHKLKDMLKNDFGREHYSDTGVIYGANEVEKVLR